MTLKIAVLQVKSPGTDPWENARTGLALCAEAKTAGAGLVLFPECYLSGYRFPIGDEQVLCPDGPILRLIQEQAARLNIGIVITAFTKGRNAPRNSAFVIGRDGSLLMQYDKVHTCDFADESCLESGGVFRVCSFDGVNLGVMICYDREYPESARVLMLQGAELILVPNDCASMRPRVQALSTRAYENMAGVVMANPPGENAGNSCAFFPVCWDKTGTCVDNTLLLAGETEEGIFYAEFDIDALRAYRESEMMGNTFRKVSSYTPLLSPEVKPPFRRGRHE